MSFLKKIVTFNKKLKEKAGSLGDFKTTYIRVPIIPSIYGNQPGQPFVLEIWPKENFSTRQPYYDYQFEELKNIVLEEYELKSAVLFNVN